MPMSAPIFWTKGTDESGRACEVGNDSLLRPYRVTRHGAGRSHWDAHMPDGSTETFTRKSDATTACEAWEGLMPGEATTAGETSARPDAEDLPQVLLDLAAQLGTTPRPTGYGYTSTGEQQNNALRDLDGLRQLREQVETQIRARVNLARANASASAWYSNGASWELVGKALGVTKQSASSRYGSKS